ncbi:uncharacterized protein LW94_1020 [Fusarium fujikuroi]|nr:uncharacterized protein LW93_4282 [Fusarium fujikuroi]KLP10419.1 uncharacterized protein Y057_2022 [Fusarium fujikuroi]KLP21509.1 uncharacterized protein LW94_1020 [Fusarium fujikuroi]
MIPRLNCQSGSGSELKSAPSCLVLFNRFGTENGQSLGHAPGRSTPASPASASTPTNTFPSPSSPPPAKR